MRSVGHAVRFRMQRNHPQVMDGLLVTRDGFFQALWILITFVVFASRDELLGTCQ